MGHGGGAGTVLGPWLTPSVNGVLTLAHAMSRPPDYMAVEYLCQRTDNAYTPGESFLFWQCILNGSTQVAWSCKPGLVVAYMDGNHRGVLKSNPAVAFVMTNASWLHRVKAVWFPQIPAKL